MESLNVPCGTVKSIIKKWKEYIQGARELRF